MIALTNWCHYLYFMREQNKIITRSRGNNEMSESECVHGICVPSIQCIRGNIERTVCFQGQRHGEAMLLLLIFVGGCVCDGIKNIFCIIKKINV